MSDVGTYGTPGLRAITIPGGGKFTVNGPNSKIWVEVIASALGNTLCPHEVGLAGGVNLQLSAVVRQVPSVINNTCFGFAQGGARVRAPTYPGPNAIGTLTRPISTQVETFLNISANHRFQGTDVVVVQGGGNDVEAMLDLYVAGLVTPAQAVANIQTAAADLANIIKTQIVAKGAGTVVVTNLPDFSLSPQFNDSAAVLKPFAVNLNKIFNQVFQQTLGVSSRIILIDIYTTLQKWVQKPQKYGFVNVKDPACLNPSAVALFCTTATVKPGWENFIFADNLHVTPYANKLLADIVIKKLKGAKVL